MTGLCSVVWCEKPEGETGMFAKVDLEQGQVCGVHHPISEFTRPRITTRSIMACPTTHAPTHSPHSHPTSKGPPLLPRLLYPVFTAAAYYALAGAVHRARPPGHPADPARRPCPSLHSSRRGVAVGPGRPCPSDPIRASPRAGLGLVPLPAVRNGRREGGERVGPGRGGVEVVSWPFEHCTLQPGRNSRGAG